MRAGGSWTRCSSSMGGQIVCFGALLAAWAASRAFPRGPLPRAAHSTEFSGWGIVRQHG